MTDKSPIPYRVYDELTKTLEECCRKNLHGCARQSMCKKAWDIFCDRVEDYRPRQVEPENE